MVSLISKYVYPMMNDSRKLTKENVLMGRRGFMKITLVDMIVINEAICCKFGA